MRGDGWSDRTITASDSAPSGASQAGAFALNGATRLWWRVLLGADVTSYTLTLWLWGGAAGTLGWHKVPSAVTPSLTYSALDTFELDANSGVSVPVSMAFYQVEIVAGGASPSAVVSILGR